MTIIKMPVNCTLAITWKQFQSKLQLFCVWTSQADSKIYMLKDGHSLDASEEEKLPSFQ